jgi:hypothetical protein
MRAPSRHWSKQEYELLDRLRKEGRQRKEIANIMGRSLNSVIGMSRHRELYQDFVGAGEVASISVPQEVWDDRNARLSTPHRSQISELMGDPRPGWSALERRA